jgi:C-terminal processing protease CtpA/Prc
MAACDAADVVVEFSAKALGIRFQLDRGALTIGGIADGSAAAQADGLTVGMVLVSVQGKQVTKVGVGAVSETLKAAGRPLRLGFSKEPRPFPYACLLSASQTATRFLPRISVSTGWYR